MGSGDNSQTPPSHRRRVRSGFAPCCRGRRSCQSFPCDSPRSFKRVNPAMQTGDQGGNRVPGWKYMRILTCLTASFLGAALTLTHPPAASAEGDQNWKTCVSTATASNEKVTACSAVIDARTETGKKLAAAYCFRGHGLTEKREL